MKTNSKIQKDVIDELQYDSVLTPPKSVCVQGWDRYSQRRKQKCVISGLSPGETGVLIAVGSRVTASYFLVHFPCVCVL
jgi:hypothetical protein